MIDEKTIFYEVRNNISMMCGDDCSGADLASAMGVAMSNKMRSVCVAPKSVPEVWPWVEKSRVKIISRFVITGAINDDSLSELSTQINTSFRDGADGAIVFMPRRDVSKFATEIVSIRDDLFFNKTFGIGIDINEIGPFDWDELFGFLQILHADSLNLTFNDDTGDKSDFVGRVFAMLNANRGKWGGVVNFILNQNIARIDQVFRLIQNIAPDTAAKTEFFVSENI